jgi:hypothetical protein
VPVEDRQADVGLGELLIAHAMDRTGEMIAGASKISKGQSSKTEVVLQSRLSVALCKGNETAAGTTTQGRETGCVPASSK